MKVLIFHGWGANSMSNWFPWLRHELEKKNIEVHCPDMPNTNNPSLSDWIMTAKEFKIDKETVLVGHSLGTVLILKLLEKIKVKSTFLVSSLDVDPEIPELSNFFKEPFYYDNIRNNCSKISLLHSDTDPLIPLKIPQDLAKKLKSQLIIFHDKEHLNMGTDNFKFLELLEMILNECN